MVNDVKIELVIISWKILDHLRWCQLTISLQSKDVCYSLLFSVDLRNNQNTGKLYMIKPYKNF